MRIAIIYPYIAHYRYAVFKELNDDQSQNLTFDFYSDIEAEHSSIRTLTAAQRSSIRWRRVRNVWILRRLLWQRGVVQLAVSGKYDAYIFLGNAYYISTWIAAFTARRRGAKVLMWTHGFRRWESAMKAKVRLSFYALADCLLVYGHRAKEILRGYGYPERRVRVVYNSMDYQKQALLRQSIDARSIDDYRVRLFGDARAAYFVYVGRVTRRKRIDILIDAFSEAYRRNDQLGLVIIGEGSELDEVRQAAHASIAADRIRFTGACYDESELALAIMGAVAVVTPGAVGLNCMHAMAYGTPVITSGDCDEHGPEVEAVVPGVTGELVEPGTVSEFARAMLSWSEKMKIREAVSDNCVAEIERAYTPKVQARLIAGACTST